MEQIWNRIHHMWSLRCLDPIYFLVVDGGTVHASQEMREPLEAHVVQLEEASIETLRAIGTFERYHTPLRMIYKCIRTETRA